MFFSSFNDFDVDVTNGSFFLVVKVFFIRFMVCEGSSGCWYLRVLVAFSLVCSAFGVTKFDFIVVH